MFIGNISQKEKIAVFAGISEFSCGDKFLSYVYWFLCKHVFFDASMKLWNCIPGIEYEEPPCDLMGSDRADELPEWKVELMKEKLCMIDSILESFVPGLPA